MADRGEARLAPDMEPDWVDEFILEARLREVPGERIGDALTEANAHCRDAGESAREAFGDPTAYARAIAAGPAPRRTGWLRLLAPVVLQIVGVVVTLTGVGAWVKGDTVTVTWGMAAMLLLLCLDVVALALVLDRVFAAVVRRPALAMVAGGVAAAVMVGGAAALLLVAAPLAELPFGAVLGAGIVVLLAGIAAELSAERSGAASDPITAPGAAGDRSARGRPIPWTSLTTLVWLAIGAVAIVLLGGR